MDKRQHISRVSHRYRVLLTILFFMIPLAHALSWVFVEQIPQHWANQQSFEVVGGYTVGMRVLAFFASMIKGGIVMYGIWALICLFKLYENGVFFESTNVTCYKKLSCTLICWVIGGIISEPLLTLILTMNNPPGKHIVQISLQSADLTALVVGGILTIIAKVMEDGQRLQEEMKLTV